MMRLSNSSSNALENYLFGIILLLERVGDYYVIITVKIVPCSDKNPPTHTHIHKYIHMVAQTLLLAVR